MTQNLDVSVFDDDDSLGDYEEEAVDQNIVKYEAQPVSVYEGDPVQVLAAVPLPGEPYKTPVIRKRNRTSKIARRPEISDLEYHARMTEEKTKFVAEDAIVKATKSRADTYTMLQAVRAEMAAEAASLRFQRIEDEKYGKDTALISSRRLDALNKIAAIEFDIKKLGADVIDLHGERFQRVFTFWISILKEVAQATLAPEQIDLFFNRLETSLEDWEEKASEMMAGK